MYDYINHMCITFIYIFWAEIAELKLNSWIFEYYFRATYWTTDDIAELAAEHVLSKYFRVIPCAKEPQFTFSFCTCAVS